MGSDEGQTCDEPPPPIYQDGDIVWAKLSGYWWPAEVKAADNCPEDLFNRKKPPFAIVRFFNEDTYETIKISAHIHHYNCDSKNDFIKKGMDAFRADNPHMEKFPIDVSAAEEKTNGNPNILSDPMFAPQKRTSIIAEIFGSGGNSPKKERKSTHHHKNQSSIKKLMNTPQKSLITHRRFLGYDDYEARIRIQYPGKDNEFYTNEETTYNLDSEPEIPYTCAQCPFETTRIQVMLFHVECHIKGLTTNSNFGAKSTPKHTKPRKSVTKKSTSKKRISTVRNTHSTSSKRPPPIKEPVSNKKTEDDPIKADIRRDLLAEWQDDDDINGHDDYSSEENEKSTEADLHSVEDEEPKKKSCFDFDDDESDESNDQKTETEDEKKQISSSSPSPLPPPPSTITTTAIETNDTNDVEETNDTTITSGSSNKPERSEPEEDKSASEPETMNLNPKKRFVRNFETAQQQQQQQQQLLKKQKEDDSDDSAKLEISKLKCQLMSKIEQDDEDNKKNKIIKPKPIVKLRKSAGRKPRNSTSDSDSDKSARKIVVTRSGRTVRKKRHDDEFENSSSSSSPLLQEFSVDSTKIEDFFQNTMKTVINPNKSVMDSSPKKNVEEVVTKEQEKKSIVEESPLPPPPPPVASSDLVDIDDTLTVKVSEKDLANGQVEITADTSNSKQKPVTLTSFSLDFNKEEPKQQITSAADSTSTPSAVVTEKKEVKTPDITPTITPTKKVLIPASKSTGKLITSSGKTLIITKPTVKSPITSVATEVKNIPKTTKRKMTDSDDPDNTFSMQKTMVAKPITTEPVLKKVVVTTAPSRSKIPQTATSTATKATILQQTIIKPTTTATVTPSTTATLDDNIFDINSMPIVLSDDLLTADSLENMPVLFSTDTSVKQQPHVTPPTVTKTPPTRVLSNVKTKLMKHGTFGFSNVAAARPGSKYVIVSSAPSKYTVGKRQYHQTSNSTNHPKTTNSGKIMILTNQQGQQQRVLLTTTTATTAVTQQKVVAVKSQPINKTTVVTSSKPSPKIVFKPRTGHVVTTATTSGIKKTAAPPVTKKTILIKNQHGQTVRRIQGTDDALLDKQVAEQLEAIKQKSALMQQQQKDAVVNYNKMATPPPPTKRVTPIKKAVVRKEVIAPPLVVPASTSAPPAPPPLSPLKKTVTMPSSCEKPEQRPLNQLVIQDAMGNQTTITEGQILALPSETVDGQPQSYMLVTLDETGNLTPLNNEALMSLDPNLAAVSTAPSTATPTTTTAVSSPIKTPTVPEPVTTPNSSGQQQQQQLILTGDPIATQKFLESLTDGTTDLTNILDGTTGGGSILIQADGQQILINTEESHNTNNNNNSNSNNKTEKNQDILAAALADTDVLQTDQLTTTTNTTGGNLYNNQIVTSNVLETSLTLNSPIMTPLEVPTNTTKKIVTDTDVLSQIPVTNIDLPITVTDPTITQTVEEIAAAQQQQQLDTSTIPIQSEDFVYSNFVDTAMTVIDQNVTPTSVNATATTSQKSDEESADYSDLIAKSFGQSTDDDDGSDQIGDGLCSLGGAICSSLSEPPPDMFEMIVTKTSNDSASTNNQQSSSETTSTVTLSISENPQQTNEDSCEIPLQPEIVTTEVTPAGDTFTGKFTNNCHESELLMNNTTNGNNDNDDDGIAVGDLITQFHNDD